MSENPCIAAIARILRSNETPSALATILFEHYSALSSSNEQSAFVIALIGELLVTRARGANVLESEITSEMIAEGAEAYLLRDTESLEVPEKTAISIYLAMEEARKRTSNTFDQS